MPSRIADRLASARREESRIMVGRAADIAEFARLIAEPIFPYFVLFVTGPGGVGKTTLLGAFAERCSAAGVRVSRISGDEFDPSPASFLDAIAKSLHLNDSAPETVLASLESEGRLVLFVDNFEAVSALDGYLRDSFIPNLPETVLIVIAGRRAPAHPWKSDPGWRAIVRIIALRNLTPTETRAFLCDRNVPLDRHDAVLEFTHGYPLALSLVADVFQQNGSVPFESQAFADVVPALLDRLLEDTPEGPYRNALELCALVRTTTEPLLADVLEIDAADKAYAWLADLSFVEHGPQGLMPHEMAREALLADLKRRHPDRLIALHRKASAYYSGRIRRVLGEEQQRTLTDFVYLHKDNSAVKAAFAWPDASPIQTDSVHSADKPYLVSMAEQHEGKESAALLKRWLNHPAAWTVVYRVQSPDQGRSAIAGFVTGISLNALEIEEEAGYDPALESPRAYLGSQPGLREGEVATFFRFWMSADTYQDVSPIQSMIVLTAVRHYLTTPGLAYTFFYCADPTFWEPAYAYAEMHRMVGHDFRIGSKSYGLFVHDWRTMPPAAWLSALADREVAGDDTSTPHVDRPPLLVLSREEFDDAVRTALRQFGRSEAGSLVNNPLLKSRIIVDRLSIEHSTALERAAVLRELLRDSVGTLAENRRREKSYQCVYKTYIEPSGSQEDIADQLDLPFSTYRRHLTTGISLIGDLLWNLETGGTA